MSIWVMWSSFETWHGKGKNYGKIVYVKSMLQRYKLCHNVDRFKDAHDVVHPTLEHFSVISLFQSRDDKDRNFLVHGCWKH